MSATKIGRYEIAGTLGKGAMGVVYKATDPTIGRAVALKTTRLDVHGTDAEELLKRFRNEARLAGVLLHPHIVTVFDAGETDGLFYIAMEYIEGQTLHKLLSKQHKLPVEQIISIARQVCAGLDCAAGHKVVHRDVKPANIMMVADGTAKIMDFGIAKAGGGLTSTGQVLGTPNYMSPEQVRGWPLDGRSDLFSFGVILYEMVTGQKPFTGDNVTTIIYKIIHEEPIPPRELDANVHPGLNAVITKALAKHPDMRYQTGAALVRDLSNYQALPASTAAKIPSIAVPPRKAASPPAASSQAAASVATKTVATAAPPGAATPAPTAGSSQIPVYGATTQAAAGAAPAPRPVPAARVVARPEARPLVLKKLGYRLPTPILQIAGGIALLLLLISGGTILYVRHIQAQERAELQRLLEQQRNPGGEANSAGKPSPVVATPVASAPAAAAAAADQPPASADTSSENPAAQPEETPPTENAVVQTGQLVLNSNPGGAQIQIDGKGDSAWRTPYTARDLKPGAHSVTFLLAGYSGETRVVEVRAGQQAFVVATMKHQPALAAINSDPAGAAISIDGKETGKLTPASLPLPAGTHMIVLHKQGFVEINNTVSVADGQSYTYANTLQPLPAAQAAEKKDSGFGGKFKKIFGGGGDKVSVQIRTQPTGAAIAINGTAQAKPSPLKTSLAPGTYEITLQLAGYKPLRKSVVVEKDKPLEINETLVKQ